MNLKVTLAALLLITHSARSLLAADLAVSVQIDGHSRLVISSGDNATARSEIVWDHLSAARPGTAGGSYPTTLNGYAWYPTWPDTPNGSPGPSSSLTNVAVRFSTNGVSLSQQAGRTTATIVQQPSAANAFTLVVDFDDFAPPGADQYVITLHGVSFRLLPQVSIQVSSVSVIWPTETNHAYQLQYSLTLTSGWSNLGPVVQGTGTNIVFTDSVLGQPRRFYRVLPLE